MRGITVGVGSLALLAAACTTATTSSTTTSAAAQATPLSTTSQPGSPEDPAPLQDSARAIAALFEQESPGAHEVEAAAATADPDGLTELLHTAVAFDAVETGRKTIAAPIGFNQRRQIVVRTPTGYDPSRPWPLIVMYHTWGGDPDLILNRLENLLGERIEDYVVAAPDDYRQTVLDAPPPVSSEHVSMWRTVRSRWHIDADRMYLAGYSLGGDTVITLSAMHPGHVAGGLAMAAGLAFPSDVPGLVETFFPNLRHVPMLQVYGAQDSLNIVGLNFREQDITLAEQNELLGEILDDLPLPDYRQIRLEGIGHSGAYPSSAEALSVLMDHRAPLPDRFTHTFRYIHQADAYWVEGHEWEDQAWLTPWPDVTAFEGESDDDALNRTIFELLGTIEASIEGQTISVETSHLADFTVWLHDGMVDWEQPVTLEVNGSNVFVGQVERYAAVALTQALRTYDFDRLRLAGIRVDTATGTARLVTSDDEFPDLARGVTF
jgi:predicted esterase